MDGKTTKAYRYLLYRAMLDIRPVAWMSLGFLNPFGWRRTAAQIRRAGVIADWLHNLAYFSAIDFERFDEDRFWEDLQLYEHRDPDPKISHYRDVFALELSGTGHLQGK